MKKHLLLLIICLFTMCLQSVYAQVNTMPYTAALDSFSAISGTTIDAPFADDQYYQNIPIGFNFDFGGTAHSVMTVSCNGYIQLDTLPAPGFINYLNGTNNNRVAALGADLMHKNSNASLQYLTIGTAPNRTCIIQWMHYSYFGGTNGDVSFQICLDETSNCIRFVYGPNVYTSSVLQTQIGLRGASNTDYLVLGDTTCNWATAYPYPSINTSFPINTSCSMPSGFAFHFGACAVTPGIRLSYITGNVFDDANGNGIKDTGEQPVVHHTLNMTPGGGYVASDGNGDYTFFFVDSSLTYTVSTGGITYHSATTPLLASIQPQTQSCSGINFGFQVIANIHEVSVSCPSWNVKPGHIEPMPIFYRNSGTAMESDTITFVMDSLYSFVSSTPSPLSVNGSTITWAYSSLAPGHSGSIQLVLMPDSNAVMGNYLNSTLAIGPLHDTIPSNNTVSLHQLISNSWDPNEKVVEPSGMIQAGTELTYTIHFQNTGNAPAENIVVKDTLDGNLDLMTLTSVASSHPMNFSMDGNRVATFTFFNIQLPDSGSNFSGSNGYVTFKVKSKTGLTPQTVINNRAGIIFDSNRPVLTNTATDTIDFVLGIHQQVIQEYTISASPNPNTGNVVFRFSDNLLDQGVLKIFTMQGQLVFQQLNLHSADVVNLATLKCGIYSVVIQTSTGMKTVKIVRE